MRNFRLHWPAIVVAAVASFVFEAVWFSVFLKPWLVGIGRSREWLMSAQTVTPAMQYSTALLCSILVGVVLSLLTQWTGEQTARRGLALGALVWMGFVATSWAKEYIFEVRTLQIFAINVGYTLFDLMLIGAITGAWKKKPNV